LLIVVTGLAPFIAAGTASADPSNVTISTSPPIAAGGTAAYTVTSTAEVAEDGYVENLYESGLPTGATFHDLTGCQSLPEGTIETWNTDVTTTSAVATGTYAFTINDQEYPDPGCTGTPRRAYDVTGSLVVSSAVTSFTQTNTATNPVPAGTSFSMTVTAMSGTSTNTAYRGEVDFSSSDAAATLPAPYTYTATDAGVHTFSGIILDTDGPQTITVTDPGQDVTVTANCVVLGPASKVVFTQQPTSAASGSALAPAVTADVEDSAGDIESIGTAATDSIGIAIGTNPGSSTLSGTTPKSAVAGVATFSNLSLNKVGTGYTLVATDASRTLPTATSNAFNITAGAATSLSFTQEPTSTIAGATMLPAVTVTVKDANGNVVPSSSVSITPQGFGFTSGSTLTGTTNASGVAIFSNLVIDSAGTGYTVSAADGGANATSSSFNVAAAAAATVTFTQQPTSTSAGATISPGVAATVKDTYGNVVAGAIVTIVPNGFLFASGTLIETTGSSGVATFSNLVIDTAGSGYTISAVVLGTAGSMSASFGVTAAVPATLTFTQQPTSTVAGNAISPAVAVTVKDSFGNVVPSSNVTLSPNGFSFASGTLTEATNSSGVATFANLVLGTAGAGFTITANDGTASATSSSFACTAGSAAKVVFTQQPTSTTSGSTISPAVTLTVTDAHGNPVASTSVTLSGNGFSFASGTLSATTNASGVATFNNLVVDTAGTGYTISATVAGTPGVTSSAFNISAGTAATLSFSAEPSSTTAGSAINPAVAVTVKDANGNVVPSSNVTLSANGFSFASGTLSQTTNSSGVATFANLVVDTAGTGYTISAADGTASTTSTTFSVGVASASTLTFTQQPTNGTAGSALSPAVAVTVKDAFGNVVSGSKVTLSANGFSFASGTLSQTTGSNGVATFPDLVIDTAGTGYTISAADGQSSATSSGFGIGAAAPSTLSFSQQPTSTPAGSSISPGVAVTVEDRFGNAVPSSKVTIAANGFSFASGTLSQTTNSSGVAAFGDLVIDTAGSGYTISASDGLASANSATFSVTAAAPSAVTFVQQPTAATAGSALSPAVTLRVTDAFGNPVQGVTVTVSANGFAFTSGTLTGSTNSSGLATFSNLVIDTAGTGYTISAAVSGTQGASSSPFSILAGAPSTVAFSQQPTNTTAGTTISPATTVVVTDKFGNAVPSSQVTLTPNGFSFATGTLTESTNASGVATFGNLVVDKAGTGFTISATDGTPSATSSAFSVSAAAQSGISFSQQPTSSTAGSAISPAVALSVVDQFGNGVPGIKVTLSPNGFSFATGSLSQSTNSSGLAVFSGLVIDTAGTGYTISAAASGTHGAISSPFGVAAGAPSALVFSQQPTSTTAGAALSPAVQVTVVDAFGNPVPGSEVTLSPNGFTFASGTTSEPTNAAGVATFSNLVIDGAGSGYTITAGDGSASATSTGFGITPASPSAIIFTQQPTTTIAGVAVTPAVAVTVTDVFGNVVPGSKVTLSAAGFSFASGTLTQSTNASGVATFGNLVIETAGTGYTLVASDGSALQASNAFAIVAAAPATVTFTAEPTSQTAGAALAPVQATVVDAFGNPVSGSNVTLTANGFSFASGTTTEATNSNGVATFSNLVIDTAGSGYTISAGDGSAAATSTKFGISPGAPADLTFVQGPTTATAGTAISPAVSVEVTDAFGNLVPGSKVTLAPHGFAFASGTLTASTGSTGVATFGDLVVDAVGSGYTISASDGSPSATSGPFSITAAAPATLTFTQEPTTTGAGATINPAVTVSAEDAFGNPVPSSNVTLSGNGFGFASGTLTVATGANGVASFGDLVIETAGTGYTMTAQDSGASVASTPFAISTGAASIITFTHQPSDATAGVDLSPAVTVKVTDAYGNAIAGSSVTLSANGFSFAAGTLTQSTNSSGVATFPGLAVDTAGSGYSINANSASASAESNTVAILAAAPATISFTQQPTATTAGTAISPSVQVTVEDAYGNPVPGSKVTLAPNGFSFASGTTSVATNANGTATFSGLVIDTAGKGYTLTASDGATTEQSATFAVDAAAAATLTFSQEPTTTGAGTAIDPAVTVTVTDAYGNPVAGSSVTLSPTGFSFASGKMTETSNAAGVASFGDLVIDSAGSGYTISAGDGSVTATSSPFGVTAAAPASLSFTTEPASGTAGDALTPAVVVTAEDAFGNPVPDSKVMLGASGFNLASGTTSAATNASGQASFGDLVIDTAGSGYTFTATDGSLTANSGPFGISAGAAASISFTQQPTDTVAGAAISPAVTVTVTDAFGNIVPSSTVSLTADGFTFAGGTLGHITNASGVASFGDLVVDDAGAGYTISASDGQVSATSDVFSVSAGAAASLTFVQQPGTTTAGSTINPSVSVKVTDAFGNAVPAAKVTLSPHGFGFASGTLTQVASSGGLATFANLVIDTAGTGYTITASDGTASALSAPFNVGAASGTQLVFSSQPGRSVVDTAMAAATVTLTDRFGNPASEVAVTLAIRTNPAQGSLSGQMTVTTNSLGEASFPGLMINRTGTGYTLEATAGSATATSDPFDVIRVVSTTTILSISRAVVGQSFAVHVEVRPSGSSSAPLSGTVEVALHGTGTTACTVTLDAGAGSCMVMSLAAGSISVAATYEGSAYYRTSSATAVGTIGAAATATAVTSSPNPSTPAHPVTISATVEALAPGGGTPAGSVRFSDGPLVLCPSVRVTATGSATCIAYIPVTIHQTISARYLGNANYVGSTSSTRHSVGHGYWLVATDGGVFGFGQARFYGSMGGRHLNKPMVGISGSADGLGYWTVASDGGIFTYGDAKFYGSTGSIKLKSPVVGMVATLTGKGYYLVAADGGIFAFGDAKYYGSTGGTKLPAPVVGMVLTQGGLGYYLVGANGSIYPFGDAQFHGSTAGSIPAGVAAVGLAPLPNLRGYWVATSNGSVYNFGTASRYGSAPAPSTPVVAVVGEADGKGYWLCTAAGHVYTFGSAQPDGSLSSAPRKPIVGMADL
jgi:hypothetical protein